MILANQTLINDSDKFMSFKFGDDCTILFYFTYYYIVINLSVLF